MEIPERGPQRRREIYAPRRAPCNNDFPHYYNNDQQEGVIVTAFLLLYTQIYSQALSLT